MGIFLEVCSALQVSPSSGLGTGERYLVLLNPKWVGGILFTHLTFW